VPIKIDCLKPTASRLEYLMKNNKFCYSTLLLAMFPLAATANENSRVIEEVIVTAQKREQGLIDVPASVSVIGGDMASEAALIDAQDMVQYTPNVKFNSSNSNPVLSIRGFGTPPLARNIEPSVGVVINDVYYGRVTFTNDGAFDMERLEVLRGPQGTLFGKNTVSGVMNFTTKAADNEVHGYINAGAGSLNDRRLEGGISFPVFNDKIGARLAFRTRDRDTGVYNTTRDQDNSQEDESFRIKLAWEITDSTTLGIEYFQTDALARGFGIQYQAATERAENEYKTHDPRFETDVYDGNESTDADSFTERHSKALTLNFQTGWQELGALHTLNMAVIANVAEIRSPFLLDTDFSPITFSTLGTDGPEGYEQKSIELRFSGDLDAPFGLGTGLDFTVGLFGFQSEATATHFNVIYYDGLQDILQAGQIGLPQGSEMLAANALIAADRVAAGDLTKNSAITRNIASLKNDSQSIFSQFTWYFSERVDLTLGARYGREQKVGFSGSQSDSAFVAKLGGQEDFYVTYAASESDLSPKLALSWEIFEDFRVFALASKGSKGGGVSGPLISPIDTTYAKEQALSKEIGIKSLFLDKTLQLNLTAYHVAYDNLQVQAFNGVQLTTLNAAEAIGKGFELDFQWLPAWQALTIAGSIGVSDTAYQNYPCAPGTAEQSAANNPAQCRNDIPRQDLSGREVPYAPIVSASFYPSLKFPISDDWGVLVGLDILHQGEHYLDIDLDEQGKQEATTKVNLRLGFKQIDGGWSIVMNAKNLSGEQERSIFLDALRNPGNYVAVAMPDEPQLSLDLRYSFGE
jgi:iron complex outermembrane receptor protein